MASPPTANDLVFGTPVLTGGRMSSSLRERLKRSSRFFKSPAASKRLCQPSTETSDSPPAGSTPYRSASSPLMHEMADNPDQPDAVKSVSSTTIGTTCDIVETDPTNPVSNSDNDAISHLSTDNHKHGDAFSEEKHFSDRTLHTTGSSYNESLPTDSCRTPTQKQHRNSREDFVSPSLCVTPCKSVDAVHHRHHVVITPVRPTTNSVDDNTYRTPCRSNFDTPCSSDASGGPITPSGGHLGDVEAALKKQKMALLERIAKHEERLRQLKMVKMYRSKNNLEELRRLIGLWRSVSQRALEQLLEQSQEPGATMSSLIDQLQLNHELIGYSAEDDSFVEL